MGISRLLSIAAFTASAAVLGIAYILLPESIWSPTKIAALIILGGMTGFAISPFFSFINKPKGGDAEAIASVGPIAAVTSVFLLWSILTFFVSLTGSEKIALTMIVIFVAGFIISMVALKSVALIIDDAASSSVSINKKSIWISKIERFISIISDLNVNYALCELKEQLRFSASCIPDLTDSIDQEIDLCLKNIEVNLMHNESANQLNILPAIMQLRSLIKQRDVTLMRLRGKN